jgi:glutamate synthase (NADPH/NADH) small chain
MNEIAEKCLLCTSQACSQACPVHPPVKKILETGRANGPQAAGALLFDRNPFSALTCRLCDWEKTCLGACPLTPPQPFYQLEQALSAPFLLSHHEVVADPSGRSAAVIGAGPAGMSTALFLMRAGTSVTIYDAQARFGGALRREVPSFRLSHTWIDALERILLEGGVGFEAERRLGENVSLSSLLQHYDAVVLALGASQENSYEVPGDTQLHVHSASSFLADPESVALGERVVVLGGGDAALDAARLAVRKDAETTLYFQEEAAYFNSQNKADTVLEGVAVKPFEMPLGMRQHSVVLPSGEVRCDTVIVAAGTQPDYRVLADLDVEKMADACPVVDENGKVKGCRGLWLAGAFLQGPGSAAEAVASARRAAESILSFFESEEEKE